MALPVALGEVAHQYRFFALQEARGRSAEYEALAETVADDGVMLEFIASLPPRKRQPQLLFAAGRFLLGAVPSIGQLRALVTRSPAELAQLIVTRRTQTNEPARCALLLPALAQLPEPLALIEAGASAGLTLLFDRYSYDYGGYQLTGSDPGAPVLRCEPRGPVPLPPRIPAITWRAGLDLNPLDVASDDDVRWLSCLVWPGEGDRDQRLALAIASARRDPPAVHRGDLVAGLPALAAQAPPAATLVIYHSSVLYQVAPGHREQFVAGVRGLGAVWLCCEGAATVPGLSWADSRDPDAPVSVIALDGSAIAVADGHGAWLQWLG
jgi:hypothetical protein